MTKALVDVRGLAGRLSTLESYDIVNNYFPQLRDRRVVTRCGIVDLKEFESEYQFFENLATNRGFHLRIFSDPGDALQWLRQDSPF